MPLIVMITRQSRILANAKRTSLSSLRELQCLFYISRLLTMKAIFSFFDTHIVKVKGDENR